MCGCGCRMCGCGCSICGCGCSVWVCVFVCVCARVYVCVCSVLSTVPPQRIDLKQEEVDSLKESLQERRKGAEEKVSDCMKKTTTLTFLMILFFRID